MIGRCSHGTLGVIDPLGQKRPSTTWLQYGFGEVSIDDQGTMSLLLGLLPPRLNLAHALAAYDDHWF